MCRDNGLFASLSFVAAGKAYMPLDGGKDSISASLSGIISVMPCNAKIKKQLTPASCCHSLTWLNCVDGWLCCDVVYKINLQYASIWYAVKFRDIALKCCILCILTLGGLITIVFKYKQSIHQPKQLTIPHKITIQ